MTPLVGMRGASNDVGCLNNGDYKHCATLPAHKKLLSVVDKGTWEFLKSVTSSSVRGFYCLA